MDAATLTALKIDWCDKIVVITPEFVNVTDGLTALEAGMKVRISNIDLTSDLECIRVWCDTTEFDEHNDKLLTRDYYDKHGTPRLTAKESGAWELNAQVFFEVKQDLSLMFEETRDDRADVHVWVVQSYFRRNRGQLLAVTDDLRKAVAYAEQYIDGTGEARDDGAFLNHLGGTTARVVGNSKGLYITVSGMVML